MTVAGGTAGGSDTGGDKVALALCLYKDKFVCSGFFVLSVSVEAGSGIAELE